MEYEQQAVNLRAGEHRKTHYLSLNTQGLVPALQTREGLITQSLAILEYLEHAYPHPPLLPAEPLLRAQVRSLSQQVATDMHPLNNLRVLQYIENDLQLSTEQQQTWYQHWIAEGFSSIEKTLQPRKIS
ncbi:MAG: glutathione S-transferase N-terminal domain-containing protein [Pseudomonadales bacterium]